ncbi:MAG TPA: FAD-binding oxidoreductase [Polyangia bacterium]|nr:FAD-binding oxidoreductase [Polyangia bacterium]
MSRPLYASRLEAAVGAQHLDVHDGRSVVRPGSSAEIADVIRVARDAGVEVALGGRRGVALDLSRMRNILHLDETSLLVQVQAGITAEALDALLAERGLQLAPLPTPSRGRTLGALLAAPRPSEASPRWGRFVQTCAGVSGLLADGTEIATRVAPRKATGPDLMHALVGGRGTLGLISSATLRLHRRGEIRHDAAWTFASAEGALRAARALLVRGGRPLDLQVSASPPTLSITVDGPQPMVDAERELAARVAAEHGGAQVPHKPPPQDHDPPHERAVPMEAIEQLGKSLDAAQAPSVRVIGWHPAGAAFVDPSRAPDGAGALHPLVAALKRRMDPDGRFPSWPGTHA